LASRADTKWVYDLSEGSREVRDLLGGKGANMAEMPACSAPTACPAAALGERITP